MPHGRLASLAMMPCAFDPLDTLGYGSVSNKDLVTCEKKICVRVCIYIYIHTFIQFYIYIIFSILEPQSL